MKLQSMTGFSSKILVVPIKKENGIEQHLHLSITLKTLNSRFFEVNCKLPYPLSFLETELIKYFKPKLHRGTVQFIIHMSDPSALTGTIEPALATIKSYLAALEKTKKEFNLQGSVALPDLLVLPNIFETLDAPLSQETVDTMWAAIHELTDTCIASRVKEGESLMIDLQRRIAIITAYMDELEPRAAKALELKKEQLLISLKALLSELQQDISSESQIGMVYNQLEKMDIHEEIFRFKTHLDSFISTLNNNDIEKGKKLDFTLQELFREINTTASKCADAQISNLAINIKVELEKAREQVQNVV